MSSLILQTAARALFHTIVVLSLYLLFAGHNAPGGGFVGGLVAGSALVLGYIAQGPEEIHRLMPVRPERLLGLGLLLAAGAGASGLVAAGAFLELVALTSPALPVFGKIKLTSVLVFDIGVYLIVVGMVLMILDTLGAEMDPTGEGGRL